jgi:hypothetical protein
VAQKLVIVIVGAESRFDRSKQSPAVSILYLAPLLFGMHLSSKESITLLFSTDFKSGSKFLI